MLNIGIVTQLPYPHDREVRGRKMSITFQNAGHNTFIICPKGTNQKLREKIKCTSICRFGYCSNNFWFNQFLSITLPINFFWVFWILKIGKQDKINLLIVRDIRLVLPTILAAKFLQIPIIWDMSENHVALTEVLPKKNIWHHIVRNRTLISILEKICVHFVDYIWVVVLENKERLKKLGVGNEKINVINNTPIISLKTNKKNTHNNILYKYKLQKKFIVLYVGGVAKLRGLELIIKSIPYIIEKEFDVKIVIIGDGPEKIKLERLSKQLNIDNYVEFSGWINSKYISDIIRSADVGVIPHLLSDLTQTTIPNKLFDYMKEGIPIISTDIKPIRKIIEETKCGIIIKNDPREMAKAILKLKRFPNVSKKMGKNGQQAVFLKYNWSIESTKIINTINNLYRNSQV